MAGRVIFSDEARADIRAIDRETALRLLKALARFLETDAGNVKQLEGFDPHSIVSESAIGVTSFGNLARMPLRSSSFGTAKKRIVVPSEAPCAQPSHGVN